MDFFDECGSKAQKIAAWRKRSAFIEEADEQCDQPEQPDQPECPPLPPLRLRVRPSLLRSYVTSIYKTQPAPLFLNLPADPTHKPRTPRAASRPKRSAKAKKNKRSRKRK